MSERYRITSEEVRACQDAYKLKYKPWRPFEVSDKIRAGVSDRFSNLITTQNGQDADDYSVGDNNKTERYLSGCVDGSDLLLLGVGTGREVLTAKAMGFKVVGTTLGSRNIDYAQDYLGLGATEILECLNEVLPFSSGSFDLVMGFQIFEHTLSPLLFLLEQRRVLRVGGKLLLEWPPADKFHMDDNPHHQVCFTPGQAYMLFRKADFDNIKLYYEDLSPIPEEDWWRADQDKMLVIEGIKTKSGRDYIRRSENV